STTHGVESLTGGVEFAPRARQRVSIRYAAAYRESPTQQGEEFALRANSVSNITISPVSLCILSI
ncbi:MAG: hypothetical protein LBJ35_08210, partial [Spirochaetaceae bacterium]|nr:hypothetical protein [Spirochaetaceae bacterium]